MHLALTPAPSQAGWEPPEHEVSGQRGLGRQDPLCGTLATGQIQEVDSSPLLVRSPDAQPRTDGVSSRLESCDVNVVELRRRKPGWAFENPCKATASAVSWGARGGGGGASLLGPPQGVPLPAAQAGVPCRPPSAMGRGPVRSVPKTSTRKREDSFCQRFYPNLEDRGLYLARPHEDPGPPSVVVPPRGQDPHELGQVLASDPSRRPSVCWLRDQETMLGSPRLSGQHLAQSDAPWGGTCFPALGVLDYRVLGTNFRDYAVVFTQLEFKGEAFSTVELYSTCWRPGARATMPTATLRPQSPRGSSQHPLPLRKDGWGTGLMW